MLLPPWDCDLGLLRAELWPIGPRGDGILPAWHAFGHFFAVKLPPLFRYCSGRFTGVDAFQILSSAFSLLSSSVFNPTLYALMVISIPPSIFQPLGSLVEVLTCLRFFLSQAFAMI